MEEPLKEKIERILDVVGETEAGAKIHIRVEHDDDCVALKTKRLSDCTCLPDIERLNPC